MKNLLLLLMALTPVWVQAQDNCNTEFEQVFKLRCPTIDDVGRIAPGLQLAGTIQFDGTGNSQITALSNSPCADKAEKLLRKFESEDRRNWNRLKNEVCSHQRGWEEIDPGTCQAGGPPPICSVQHWVNVGHEAAMDKYKKVQGKVWAERFEALKDAVSECIDSHNSKVKEAEQAATEKSRSEHEANSKRLEEERKRKREEEVARLKAEQERQQTGGSKKNLQNKKTVPFKPAAGTCGSKLLFDDGKVKVSWRMALDYSRQCNYEKQHEIVSYTLYRYTITLSVVNNTGQAIVFSGDASQQYKGLNGYASIGCLACQSPCFENSFAFSFRNLILKPGTYETKQNFCTEIPNECPANYGFNYAIYKGPYGPYLKFAPGKNKHANLLGANLTSSSKTGKIMPETFAMGADGCVSLPAQAGRKTPGEADDDDADMRALQKLFDEAKSMKSEADLQRFNKETNALIARLGEQGETSDDYLGQNGTGNLQNQISPPAGKTWSANYNPSSSNRSPMVQQGISDMQNVLKGINSQADAPAYSSDRKYEMPTAAELANNPTQLALEKGLADIRQVYERAKQGNAGSTLITPSPETGGSIPAPPPPSQQLRSDLLSYRNELEKFGNTLVDKQNNVGYQGALKAQELAINAKTLDEQTTYSMAAAGFTALAAGQEIWERGRERKRQAEELERQRKLQQMREQKVVDERKKFVQALGPRKYPTSMTPHLNSQILGYFVSWDEISYNNFEFAISYPLLIERLSDGTWPLLPNVTSKLKKKMPYANTTFISFFNTGEECNNSIKELISAIDKKGGKIKFVEVEKQTPRQENDTAEDYWNN